MDDLSHKDFLLLVSLSQCCRQGLVAGIEGVRFDLTHPELDRSNWVPETLLGWPYGDDVRAPRLIFPWFGNFEKRRISQMATAIIVQPGDTLRIGEVRSTDLSTDLGSHDHPHHKLERFAILAIERPNGEIAKADPPWKFVGVADVMGPIRRGDYKAAQQALLVRLEKALDVDDADDVVNAKSPDDWPAFSANVTELDELAAKAGWAAEREMADGAAMAFGYLIGRMEAREFLLPDAQRQREQVERLRQGAKKRRRTGDETRAAAIRMIERQPDITLTNCVRRVAAELGKNPGGVRAVIESLFVEMPDGKMRPDLKAVAEMKAILQR